VHPQNDPIVLPHTKHAVRDLRGPPVAGIDSSRRGPLGDGGPPLRQVEQPCRLVDPNPLTRLPALASRCLAHLRPLPLILVFSEPECPSLRVPAVVPSRRPCGVRMRSLLLLLASGPELGEQGDHCALLLVGQRAVRL